MIQPMNKRRSGLAVLAVGALIASVLAAGVLPAGAVTDRPDHTTPLSACVGDAVVDQLFADVSAGHVFRDAINCVAYYGITHGTGDGSTYSPEQDVTRAQMAVFIARAAVAAGVELDPAGDARFNDIADIWQEAQDAINRLALTGMIPAGGSYRPHDAITRAEMATFLIGLLLEAAPNVSRDSTSGAILLGQPGSGSQADDRFPDTGSTVIAAIYELGVTRGASAARVQDPTEPPLDLNYEPDATVDRGQMAAFITRALAHTPVRPAGVSAQYNGADVIVSVRDAAYRPVSGAVVDVFWTPADQAGQALSSDGTCRASEVTPADHSLLRCEIDEIDPATDGDGDATVSVVGLRRVPAGGATVWAWTGMIPDVLGADTDLYRFDVAEGADAGFATSTLVTTTFNANKARFGSTILFIVQLQDVIGDVANGLNGLDPAQWNLTVRVPGQDPVVSSLESGPTGRAVFSLSADDPSVGSDDPDVTVRYELATAANAPILSETVDARGRGAARGSVTFSDDPSSIAGNNATVTIDTRDYIHVVGTGGANAATVTVLDQYGDTVLGTTVNLSSSVPRVIPGDGGVFPVDRRGSHRFTYEYLGSGGVAEILTARYGVGNTNAGSETATVYWAADAGPDDDGPARPVLSGDVTRRHIIVDDVESGVTPVLLEYDDNDRFNVSGDPVSFAVFQSVLADELKLETPDAELEWSGYRPGNPSRVAEYNLIP